MSKLMFLLAYCLIGLSILSWAQGSSYAGKYTHSAHIEHVNKSNFVINGLEIKNTSNHCIALSNCHNVTIRNCKFGPSPAYLGIYLYNCTNISISNCLMENLQSAVLAVSSSGIMFEYNEVKNVQGPFPRGQMVQFAYVSGGGNSISFNVSENIQGESNPEDIINIYMSSGTVDSPILISNNWIRGGGPSISGGGIMLGDKGGSYILVENNILVDPGQYGIGIASGHHITVSKNKVYGKKQKFTNVGIYAWEQYNLDCHDITISNNEVNFTHKDGLLNNWWFSENVGSIAGRASNLYSPILSPEVLPTQISRRAMNPVPMWISGCYYRYCSSMGKH